MERRLLSAAARSLTTTQRPGKGGGTTTSRRTSRASRPGHEDAVNADGRRSRPPAMTDVAKLAGVSHQTVSRVLNGHPSVRPRTRALVLSAVDELSYRPNTAARALATGRSRTLGVLTLPGTYYGPMSSLYGVEQAAREAGYSVTVASLLSADPAGLQHSMEQLAEQGVAGVVAIVPLLATGQVIERWFEDLPFVAVEGQPGGGHAVVCVDQRTGAKLATEHLLQAGHRTVWHVGGPAGWSEAAGRLAGWREVLEQAGADVPPVLPGDWSPLSGFQAGQLLARMDDVTAVFAANDQTALGLMRALHEAGRRVPEDVSVVGFDDIPEAAFLSPPLTTVRQDFTEVGRQSLRTVIAQIETGRDGSEHVVIQPQLVVRRSTTLRH